VGSDDREQSESESNESPMYCFKLVLIEVILNEVYDRSQSSIINIVARYRALKGELTGAMSSFKQTSLQ